MDEVFRVIDFISIYIDDIVCVVQISSKRILGNSDLKRLSDFGITIDNSKSIFGVKELEFLSHTVTKDGVLTN